MPSDVFDPYYRLLGIPPEEQPANHYRLLGLSLFESDPEVINDAAGKQTNHVRMAATSEYADATQRLLNEIAAAKLCLLNATKREDYNKTIRSQSESAAPQKTVQHLAYDPSVAPDSWLIGRSLGCQVVIDEPTLSRLHCVLEATSKGLFVLDKGSDNGVFVNGSRTKGTQQVQLNDTVTLGKRVTLPWPSQLFGLGNQIGEWSIGRLPKNDIQIDEATVSSVHCRLIQLEEGIVVQDLGSANGTTVGEHRIRCAQVQRDETLLLGTHPMPLKALLD